MKLSWNRIALDDLSGFQIYRKSAAEENFSRYDITQNFEFIDTNVEFGVTYTYKISAVGNDFESAQSDSVCIEPGPTFNWAIGSPDDLNLALIKYTHDFRHEIHRTFGFLLPKDIEIDYRNGQAWVLDEVNFVRTELVRVTSFGDVITPTIPLTRASDLEIERSSGAVWVGDVGDSTVKKFNNRGVQLFSIGGFQEPVALGVDQMLGYCWVADIGRGEVVRINSDGIGIQTSVQDFENLKWLAVHSNTGAVWVATKTQLIKLNQDGAPEFTVGQTFNNLQKIEVNQKNGDVWVISWSPYSVYKFTDEGMLVFEVEGFSEPIDLSINEFDNSCVVSDTESDQIVKIKADGESVTIVQEIIFPSAIAVQNDYGLF